VRGARAVAAAAPLPDDRVMDGEPLGWKFWAGFLGCTVLAGIGALICFVIFGAMWASWGLLGAMIAVTAIALVFAWVRDRREAHRFAATDG
jgi:Kef-type K+ transport system membrane component KefB